MQIAIVEDRAADRAVLRQGLARWAQEKELTLPQPVEFDSAEALLAAPEWSGFDLIFLDIYMDGQSGMDAARCIREAGGRMHIVFTTTSAEFAVDSYAVSASYYLLKPYSYVQLCDAMNRCGAAMLEQERSIVLPGRYGEERILLHRITYAEYVSRKVLVHFADGQETQVNMGWSEFSAKLLHYPFFCDCMKGLLVNFEAVQKLTEDCFVLRGDSIIPISRLKFKDVRKLFIDWSYQKARSDGG